MTHCLCGFVFNHHISIINWGNICDIKTGALNYGINFSRTTAVEAQISSSSPTSSLTLYLLQQINNCKFLKCVANFNHLPFQKLKGINFVFFFLWWWRLKTLTKSTLFLNLCLFLFETMMHKMRLRISFLVLMDHNKCHLALRERPEQQAKWSTKWWMK